MSVWQVSARIAAGASLSVREHIPYNWPVSNDPMGGDATLLGSLRQAQHASASLPAGALLSASLSSRPHLLQPEVLRRSVFTDHGPIAKPPLVLQSGASATIVSPTDVTCTGGAFSTTVVGKLLVLSGPIRNTGEYRILSVLGPNRLRVAADLDLSVPGSTSWQVVDPREGEIADSPLDVVVRVNGLPVVPETVSGLGGQVVLPSAPGPEDTVSVDYSWMDDPVVDLRALNDPEFVLNGMVRVETGGTQHRYRYRSILLRPEDFRAPTTVKTGGSASILSTTSALLPGSNLTGASVGMRLFLTEGPNAGSYTISGVSGDTVTVLGLFSYPDAGSGSLPWQIIDPNSDFQARLAEPLLRDLKYRAYERSYTAVLNDPNLLTLNVPSQRIAFPPLSRPVEGSFVNYEPTTLPEIPSQKDPWTRHGPGSASVVGAELVITAVPPSGADGSIYWTRPIDLTFDHVLAMTWRFRVDSVPALDGVFTGLTLGFSNDSRAFIIGCLDDSGTRKIGILRAGRGTLPSQAGSWTGGLLPDETSSGIPVAFDWAVPHSYRVLRDRQGVIRVYVDGEVSETLRVHEDELPFLEELDTGFSSLEGVFFGSISRTAQTVSSWDFVRYTVIPTNPAQTAYSSFASYEATNLPEVSTPPWTPVGAHGNETADSGVLVLDSTSATTADAEVSSGLVGGDFRGFVRFEPLLAASSDVFLDVAPRIRTFTHGVAPNAVMAAVDDGNLLTQLSFLTDSPSPKYSYGGRVLPDEWGPTPWQVSGTAQAGMWGRALRISDTTTTDGRVYGMPDTDGVLVSGAGSFICEFKTRVVSHTPDTNGFCGVTMDAYNGDRTVGVLLHEESGVRHVALHSDGNVVSQWAWEWDDDKPHVFRTVVNLDASLVILFVDGGLVGTADYNLFTRPPVASPIVSWGSGTAGSVGALSVVDWHYANVWRVNQYPKKYVGVWRGVDSDSLLGYHLPVKVEGRAEGVGLNCLSDPRAMFVTLGVVGDPTPGNPPLNDHIIVDAGPNRGVYKVKTVLDPVPPTEVGYRIPAEIDWTQEHRYRLARDPSGGVALLLDSDPSPVLRLGYDSLTLPPSSAGIIRTLTGGLPGIAFGAFDPTNLSQTARDYVRYGIVRPPGDLVPVPPHQVLNQRNVISSPEHLRADEPHEHTDFWSGSTGIPPQTAPDFLQQLSPAAYTRLNEGTPLVPMTQTSEVRHPVPVVEFVSASNSLRDVLNARNGFVLNDPTRRVKLLVPNDVLYNSIQVIETTQGDACLLAPAQDRLTALSDLSFQKEVCLSYTGDVLPEADMTAATPWTLDSLDPNQVRTSVFSGVLTYGTTGATCTIYRNHTHLPDAVSLTTEYTFEIALSQDSSLGLGDSQARFGFSAPGLTFGLGLVTTGGGERYVTVYDLNSGEVMGGIPFDYLDGITHSYRVLYSPGMDAGSMQLFIDS